VLSGASRITTTLLILCNRSPSQETPESHHTPLEQQVAIKDCISSQLVLDVHFPSDHDMILPHLDRILHYLHLSDSDDLIILTSTDDTLFKHLNLLNLPLPLELFSHRLHEPYPLLLQPLPLQHPPRPLTEHPASEVPHCRIQQPLLLRLQDIL
jgi:hypothetical protein